MNISVIVPITHQYASDIVDLHQRYEDGLRAANVDAYEFIYVVSPAHRHLIDTLAADRAEKDSICIIEVARNFGEATAINLGSKRAKYDQLLTLTALEQISPEKLPEIISELDDETDLVLVRRWPRIDDSTKQLPSKFLRYLSEKFSDAPASDAGCGIRFFRKYILDEINLYGEFHRFIAMLAYEQGYSIKVKDIPQSRSDNHPMSSVWTYLSRILDFLTIIFLTRFNKRPLRFFGSVGSFSMVGGAIGLAYIAIERFFFDVAAADRPMMLLFTLAIVLGIQLIAIGLVGESLIFTHARDLREYKIKKIHTKK